MRSMGNRGGNPDKKIPPLEQQSAGSQLTPPPPHSLHMRRQAPGFLHLAPIQPCQDAVTQPSDAIRNTRLLESDVTSMAQRSGTPPLCPGMLGSLTLQHWPTTGPTMGLALYTFHCTTTWDEEKDSCDSRESLLHLHLCSATHSSA